MRDLKLSLVCPVYNEGANIGPLLERLGRAIEIPMELVVVYDHDEDDTLPAVSRLRPRFPVRTVKNRFGRGALSAIKTGFAEASGEATLVIMADLSDDLRAVRPMFELIQQGHDVVCGSRYMRGGRQVGGYVSGGRIAEVPSTWTDRVAGRSRFRLWRWLPHYLRWYFYAFRGRFRRSPT